MVKRLLAMLLTVLMVFSVLPLAVFATETSGPNIVIKNNDSTTNGTSNKEVTFTFSDDDIGAEYQSNKDTYSVEKATFEFPVENWGIAVMSPSAWNADYVLANVCHADTYVDASGTWGYGKNGCGFYLSENGGFSAGQLTVSTEYKSADATGVRKLNKLQNNVTVRYTAPYYGEVTIDVAELKFATLWGTVFSVLVNGKPVGQFDEDGFSYANGTGWYAPSSAGDVSDDIDAITLRVYKGDAIDFVFRGTGADVGGSTGHNYSTRNAAASQWKFAVTYADGWSETLPEGMGFTTSFSDAEHIVPEYANRANYPTGTAFVFPVENWEIGGMSPSVWDNGFYQTNLSLNNGEAFRNGGWMAGSRGCGFYFATGQLVASSDYKTNASIEWSASDISSNKKVAVTASTKAYDKNGDGYITNEERLASATGDEEWDKNGDGYITNNDRTFRSIDSNVTVRYTAPYYGQVTIDVNEVDFVYSWSALFCILVNGQPVEQFKDGFSYASGDGWYVPTSSGDEADRIDSVSLYVKEGDKIDFVFRCTGKDATTLTDGSYDYNFTKRVCDDWNFSVTYEDGWVTPETAKWDNLNSTEITYTDGKAKYFFAWFEGGQQKAVSDTLTANAVLKINPYLIENGIIKADSVTLKDAWNDWVAYMIESTKITYKGNWSVGDMTRGIYSPVVTFGYMSGKMPFNLQGEAAKNNYKVHGWDNQFWVTAAGAVKQYASAYSFVKKYSGLTDTTLIADIELKITDDFSNDLVAFKDKTTGSTSCSSVLGKGDALANAGNIFWARPMDNPGSTTSAFTYTASRVGYYKFVVETMARDEYAKANVAVFVNGKTVVDYKEIDLSAADAVDQLNALMDGEFYLTEGDQFSLVFARVSGSAARVNLTMMAHRYTAEVTREATCTEAGEKVLSCSCCGDTYTKEIPAGHTTVNHAAKAPTCTEIGWDAYEECTRCDYTSYVEKAALGHDYKSVVTGPTFDADGYTTYTCSRCANSYEDNRVPAKVAVAEVNGVKYESLADAINKAPDGGTITLLKDIEMSSGHQLFKSLTIDLNNHTITMTAPNKFAFNVVDKDRTGTFKNGTIIGHPDSNADRGGYSLLRAGGTRPTIICENLKVVEQGTVEGTDRATYALSFNTVGTFKDCEFTGDIYYYDSSVATFENCKVTGSLHGSSKASVTILSGTYSEKNTTVKIPDGYAWLLNADGTYTVAPHAEHNWEETGRVEAACLEAGHVDYKCSACGETKTETIEALGHDIVKHAAQAPTYNDKGWNEYETCNRCDYTTYVELPEKEGAVAEVNGVKYGTLAEAYSAVSTGGTVKLLADIMGATGKNAFIDVVKSFTLDLNGHTIEEHETSYTAHGLFNVVSENVTFTIKNGTLIGHAPFADRDSYGVLRTGGNNPTIHCENLKVYAPEGQLALRFNSVSTTATVTNCELYGDVRIAIGSDAYSATIENCTVDGKFEMLTRFVTIVSGTFREKNTTAKIPEGSAWLLNADGTYTVAPHAEHQEELTATQDATCTADGYNIYTCTACGNERKETIPMKGHSYTEAVTAPTCTEQGYTTHTCSACGDSYKDTYVAALNHRYDEGVITTDPTCTEKGVKTFTCGTCGDKYTEEIGKLDHDYKAVVTDPTCTEQGYTTYTCACGESYVDNYVDALGHKYDAVVTDPTCTAQGYTTYTCVRGDHSYVDNYTNALGHSYDDGVVTTAPTCNDEGIKTYTCHCGHSYTEAIEALGHSITVVVEVVAPTCTADGYTVYKCERCDVTEQRDVTPAKGHSYSEKVVDPTCTDKGYTVHFCACGDNYVDNYTDALGHRYTSSVTKEPTCTEKGVLTYTCGTCGDKYTEEIEAKGHSYSERVVDPTCTDKGYTVHFCACGESYVDTYVDALGHRYTSSVTKEPTCTEKGVLTYTCGTCGHSYTEDIEAKGHSYSEKVTDPTCTDKGYTTYTCACGDSYVGNYVDELGHTEGTAVVENNKAPDCVNAGSYDNVIYCTVCKVELSRETVPVDALGHKYEAVVTNPTCTTEGYTTHTCSVCGDTYKDTYVNAFGHSYVLQNTVAASCTKNGHKDFTCQWCGGSKQEVIPATGHSYTKTVTDPTCTEQGYTTYTCVRGDHSYVDNYVDALDHKYNKVETAPDCVNGGYTTYTCAVCGDSYVSDKVDALGHTKGEAVVENNKAPTCTADGSYDNVVYCTVCKVELSRETVTVPATGHEYVNGECICGDRIAVEVPDDAVDNIVSGNEGVTKEEVEEIVDELQKNDALLDEAYKPVEEHEDVDELIVTVHGMNIGSDKKPTKIVYNVSPMKGNVKVTAPAAAITFRLPVPDSVTETHAKVYHNNEPIGTYEIKGVAGGRYVEVESANFSEFTVEFVDYKPYVIFITYLGGWTIEASYTDGTSFIKALEEAYADEGSFLGAADSYEIVLYEDAVLAEDWVIPAGKTIIVDLNGNSISSSVINNGSLTVKDSMGTADEVSVSILNNGTVTQEGGYIAIENTAGATFDQVGGEAEVTNPVVYVAEVDGEKFASLQEAINAANGKVVTLLTDVVLEDTLTIPYGVSVTLELAGFRITQEKVQTAGYQMILVDGDLTVKSELGDVLGEIVYTDLGNGGEYVSNTITVRGSFTLLSGSVFNQSSATVANNGYPYAIDTSIWGAASEVNVTIAGGKVSCENYSAIRLRADSTTEAVNVTVSGGMIYGRIEVQNPQSTIASKGQLTITGGEINKYHSSMAIMVFGGGGSGANMKAEITGGTVKGAIGYSSYFGPVAGFDENVIKGGSFDTDVTAFVADGYVLADNGDGTYGVAVDPAFGKVAMIGDTYYATLAEAVAAAEAGQTIVLIADVTVDEAITVAAGEDVILNLAGFDITVTNGSINLYIEGKLTINDTVGGGVSTFRNHYVQVGGELIVNGGILQNVATNTGGYAIYNNGGKLTVNGGEIRSVNATNYAIALASGSTTVINDGKIYGRGGISVEGGKLTVEGGEISCTETVRSTSHALWISSGEVTINGGTFYAKQAYNGFAVDIGGGKLTINGGSFVGYHNGETLNNCLYLSDGSTGVVEITGGNFNYGISEASTANGTVTVSGGTFGQAVKEKYCAEGFIPKDNGDGTYGVAVDPAFGKVAMIGDTYYATLAEAVAAAEAGQTIVLIADAELSATLVLQKSITIDADGHKIIPAADFAGVSALMVGESGWSYNANLTVTLKDATFEGFATSHGVVRVQGAVANIEGCTFAGNTQTLESFAIVSYNYASGAVVNSSFNNNNCALVINMNAQPPSSYVPSAAETLTVSGNVFEGNTCSDAGVLYYTKGAGITVTDNKFLANKVTATSNAGVLYFGEGNAVITGNLFRANEITKASNRSGVLLLENDTTVTGNAFVDNVLNANAAHVATALYKADLGSEAIDLSGNYWDGGKPDFASVKGAPAKAGDYYTTYVDGVLGGYTKAGLAGSGTQADPFLITSLDDLILFRDSVNAREGIYEGKYVKLTADIDLNQDDWTPIVGFTGTFDGDGHTISNLWVTGSGAIGFFAQVGTQTDGAIDGTVKNLTFENVTIISSNDVAGVIADARSGAYIENVHVKGEIYVSGYRGVGALVGAGFPTIKSCSVIGEGEINASYWGAGAILGFANDVGAKISDVTVQGTGEGLTVYGYLGGVATVTGSPYGANVNGAIAKNVTVESDSDYCMGYIAAGGTVQNASVENVTATAAGGPITPADAVATANGKIFFDLQSAINEGGTVTLLRDISVEGNLNTEAKGLFNIAEGNSVVLDLGGKKITATDKSVGHFILFYNLGEITVTNGTIEMTAANNRGWNGVSSILTNRGGVAVIENCTIEHKGGTSMAFALDNSANSFGDAYMTVNSGTIKSTYTAIRMRMENPAMNGNPGNGISYLTVNGGEIYGASRGIWGHKSSSGNEKMGELAITGGTIGGGSYAISIGTDSHEAQNVFATISGTAVINGALSAQGDELSISGGTFSAPVAEEYCADGFIPKDNGDGTYGVKEGHYVAEVDGVKYESLQEAINAADGKTVVLLADVDMGTTGLKIVGKAITLDLNGKTVSGQCLGGERSLVYIENGAKLTLKDSATGGKLIYTPTANGLDGYTVDVKGEFVLESGTVELAVTEQFTSWNVTYAVNVRPNEWGTPYTGAISFVMNGGKVVSADAAIRLASSSSKSKTVVFEMNGGSVEAVYDAVFVQQGDAANYDTFNVTVNGGSLTGRDVFRIYGMAPTTAGQYYNFALNGGTMTRTGDKVRDYLVGDILCANTGLGATVAANGKVTASAAIAQANAPVDGFKWVEENGVFVLTECHYVAEVDGVKFESLQAAIDAADGKTVVLLADVTVESAITVAAGKDVILNLAGFDITVANGSINLYIEGKLTINDTVGGGVSTFRNHYVKAGGELTVNGGTIQNVATATGGFPIYMEEGAKVTVNNGTVQAVNNGNYAIKVAANSELTVTGGTVQGKWGAIHNSGKVTVNGGNINVTDKVGGHCIYVGEGSETVITGGTFAPNGESASYVAFVDGNNASVEISGGTFNVGWNKCMLGIANGVTGSDIAVSGGIFSAPVSKDFCAEGYIPADNGDGTYGVVAHTHSYVPTVTAPTFDAQGYTTYNCSCGESYVDDYVDALIAVAIVDGERFETLQEAIDAAEGKTVTLLGNVTYDTTLVITKSLVLDGAGYTITYTGVGASARAININCAEEIVVKDLTIDASQAERAINVIQKAAQLTLENVNAKAASYAINVAKSSVGSAITVNGGKIEGYAAINVTGNDTTVTVTDAELVGTNSNTTADTNSFGVIAIGDAANGNTVSGVTVTVIGGKIIAKATANASQTILYVEEGAAASATVILDTELVLEGANTCYLLVPELDKVSVSVRDDYAAAMTEEGYILGAAENGLIPVQQHAEASVNGVNYASLMEALAVAQSGQTVTLLNNVTYAGYVFLNPGVVLDLNGYTLTASGLAAFGQDAFVIDNGATKGLLAIPMGTLISTKAAAPMLPLYNEEGTGYVFVPVKPQMEVLTESTSNVTVPEDGFTIRFRPSVKNGGVTNDVFKDGASDNGLTFIIYIHCINEDGKVVESLTFAIDDSLVSRVYNASGAAIGINVRGAAGVFAKYQVELVLENNNGLYYSYMGNVVEIAATEAE